MVLGKICNADNVGNVFLPTATHFKPDYTEDENLTSFKTQNMNLRCWKRSLEKILFFKCFAGIHSLMDSAMNGSIEHCWCHHMNREVLKQKMPFKIKKVGLVRLSMQMVLIFYELKKWAPFMLNVGICSA